MKKNSKKNKGFIEEKMNLSLEDRILSQNALENNPLAES